MTKKQRTEYRKPPRCMDLIDDSDDEEINEDEAFNSDDERRYGAFFSSKNKKKNNREDDDETESDADSDNDIASNDDEDDGDGGQYMIDLLNQLDASPESSTKKEQDPAAIVKESEFAASVLKSGDLTLDDLMVGLEDTKGFGVMQKKFKEVASGKTTSAPVASIVSNRAQRKVAYKHSSQDVTGWIEAVQQNRQAETLDFRPKERPDLLTKNILIDKFQPTTEFEKQLAEALKHAGQQDESSVKKAEETLLADDLGSNEITLEEFQRRRGQLAKMRALMFYHEQKRHHINKIKSKKYRRIRKKQRERVNESELSAQLEEDHELAREMEEKEEMERMQERMTLAHKNTSKWAKRVLRRGKNVDMDTRKALSAQLQRGDDLRRKMRSIDYGNPENESDDSENEDLLETARKVLTDSETGSVVKSTGKGLFKLSFMQKGIEKQRERAKCEARELLMELEENEQGLSKLNDDEKEEESKKKSRKKKASSSKEIEKIIEPGKMVTKSLNFGNSSTITVNEGIDVDINPSQVSKAKASGSREETLSQYATTLELTAVKDIDPKSDKETERLDYEPSRQVNPAETTDEKKALNPWLKAARGLAQESAPKKKKPEVENAKVNKDGFVKIEGAGSMFSNDLEHKAISLINQNETGDDVEKNIASMTQEELVRRAFVAPKEHETEEEFSKEKADAEERDDPNKKKKGTGKGIDVETVDGWGSWAGKGASKPTYSTKSEKHLQVPLKNKKRKRRDERKPHLIINEKRLKKTAKFQIAHIPHPYTSREQYERAMAGAIGKEWNVSHAVKAMTRPDIMTRAGKIIQPISKRAKQQRPAAKF
mmetsp:Transcript_1566/g.2148  ORF Transcript_1566/g.2148 Transcript_1566/m.2148 type:complete len:829 (-) Transcript_1566:135-2621(-)|eukprot:CAMPEP_0178926106 /NCGR_PEP_ID=MMETSP0786-20121207/18318_1 /TAXON_ID=186022 /ORGANISM="Thalassionema frauenfeldii, Strain CCMP 1798" /LENGTH=828 /DNA_ID=CAMNT_0020601131 /DNA_START=21 /DNA_END=2507 /DNA_ORIENTATION=+